MLCTIFSLIFSCYFAYASSEVIITTKLGKIRGFEYSIPEDDRHTYNVFLGIPFAQKPIRNLRFQHPQKLNAFAETIINATDWKHACVQFYPIFSHFPASEDCLYLNIFAPKPSKSNKKYPVLFWIHGGAYQFGTAREIGYEFPIRDFVSQDIIFVSIQYRLGPLGFLPYGYNPGNQGLWDQKMALEFVSENIEAFGGDRNRITVMGESAGAGSTSQLTLSQKTQNLFSDAIQMSGSSLAEWAFDERSVADQKAEDLAKFLQCTELECLQEKSVDNVKAAVDQMKPILEEDFFSGFSILDLFNKASKKPTLSGVLEQESELFTILPGSSTSIEEKDYPSWNLTRLDKYIKESLLRTLPDGIEKDQLRELLLFEYGYGRCADADFACIIFGYVQLLSDYLFNVASYVEAQLKTKRKWPTWFYKIDHINPDFYPRNAILKKATHAADLRLFFNHTLGMPYAPLDRFELAMKANLLHYWCNFIKTGDPNGPDVPIWQATSTGPNLPYLSVGQLTEIKPAFHQYEMQLWTRLMPKLLPNLPPFLANSRLLLEESLKIKTTARIDL